ncbi:hypothetical protein GCM10027276_29210 [Comamonas piscis]
MEILSMVKKSNVPAVTTATPQLDSEFANRLKDPFENAYMGVLRTNDPLLLERGQGSAELYRDLKRDGKVFGGLQKRQLALVGKPWQVEPRVKDDAKASKDAETLTAILKGFAFDRMCGELLDALLTGLAVSEIIWTVQDDLVVPKRVIKRATRRFVYVQQDADSPAELRLLTRENMVTGVLVPDRKFIVHRVNPEDDNPYGTGLGLQLFWPVFFKRKGIVAWNKLNDRFGSPTPHGKYPRNATPKEKNTLADALRAMSNDGYVLTPEAYATGLWERVERSKAVMPYVRYITRGDDRVRPAHLAWDNLTLPVDDDFWKTHWPPNGWRCRCRVMSMTKADYKRGYTLDRPGAEINPDAPLVRKPLNTVAPPDERREYVNPRSGEVVQVPVGIDPGFAYNPGQARQQALEAQLQGKLNAANPALADAARKAGMRKD